MILFLFACSLGRYEREACEISDEGHQLCASLFGKGQYCNNEGYCEPFEDPRCQLGDTRDQTSTWDKHSADIVIGRLFDSNQKHQNTEAVNLAIRQAREKGGLGKEKFIAYHCDIRDDSIENALDGLNKSEAIALYTTKLMEEVGLKTIIGPADSNDTLETFEVINEKNSRNDKKVVLVSPVSSSNRLTEIDGVNKSDESPGLFWRTVSSDATEAIALGSLIMPVNLFSGPAIIRVIYESTEYGKEFVDYLSDEITRVAPETSSIFLYSFSPPENNGEEDENRTRNWHNAGLEANTGDHIVFISESPAENIKFINDVIDLSLEHYQGLNIFLTSNAANRDFLEQTGTELDGKIYGTRFHIKKTQRLDKFKSEFESEYGTLPDNNAAHFYDGTWLSLYGISWAIQHRGILDGKEVATGLRQLSGDVNPIAIDAWSLGSNELSQGKQINLRGVTGELDYDLTTEELSGTIELWKIGASRNCFKPMISINEEGDIEGNIDSDCD